MALAVPHNRKLTQSSSVSLQRRLIIDTSLNFSTDPFNNTDLTTISSDTLDAMNNMREAAESAETDDFDPQIDAASGATADALSVGKTKNKVLKLTAEVQVLNIKVYF